MSSITVEQFFDLIREYNIEDFEKIKKANELAEQLHKDQVRQSGEPYIIHPLNVAYILAEMHADSDTVCAGLLHDVIEDTDITKEELTQEFNDIIANLVEGVTKISKLNFSTRQEQTLANTRKIIVGLTGDVRIIIIKLADRVHNMRTLQFKSEFKQKENAIETMEIFVPIAYYIGAYMIKSELEDLALRYLKPDVYCSIEEKREKIENDSKQCLAEVLQSIRELLNENFIPNEMKFRVKNIYGIYKQISLGKKIANIHDLLALKVIVNTIANCYQTLGLVHSKFHPINDRFKDYIYNPKTNMYRSLHTTLFCPGDRIVQSQIRTFEMDRIASFGLTAYWEVNKGAARIKMQEYLRNNYQFFQSLVDIDATFKDNEHFINQVKNELFTERIYVYTTKGDIVELPNGSTPIDFAYKIHTDIGNTMIGAYVNEECVPVDTLLQNKDRVRILTDNLSFGPREDWADRARTSYARKKIRDFSKE